MFDRADTREFRISSTFKPISKHNKKRKTLFTKYGGNSALEQMLAVSLYKSC